MFPREKQIMGIQIWSNGLKASNVILVVANYSFFSQSIDIGRQKKIFFEENFREVLVDIALHWSGAIFESGLESKQVLIAKLGIFNDIAN